MSEEHARAAAAVGEAAGGAAAARAPRGAQGRLFITTPWPPGFNVLAVSMLFQGINFGVVITSFTLFAERWTVAFGVPRSEIMLAATLGAIAPALLGPIAGRVMDTRPARRVVAGGLLVLVLGFALLAQVAAVWHVVLLYAFLLPVAGAFAGVIPAQVLAARWFPRRRGLALGLVSSGVSLGGVLVPPVVVALMEAVGWRMTYGVFALFTLLVVLPLVLLFLRSGPEGEDPRAFQAAQAPAPGQGGAHTIATIIRERTFWVLLIFLFPMGMALSVIQFNLAGLASERGLTMKEAGALLSILSSMLLAAKFLWGYLADRVEPRLLFAAAALANALGCFGLSLAAGFFAMAAALVVVGLATGGMLPLVGAALSREFGPAFGRAFGLVTMSLPLTLVGPPIAARLQESWGSYAPVLAVTAAFVATAILAALFLRPKAAMPATAPASGA